jgi:hypothetical protein
MATEAELLTSINTALADLIANPKVSYRIGDISYNTKEYGDYLVNLREQLLNNPTSAEVIEPQAIEVTEFGEDVSEVME